MLPQRWTARVGQVCRHRRGCWLSHRTEICWSRSCPARGVFLGIERKTVLAPKNRQHCELAAQGGSLAPDDWLAIADDVLAQTHLHERDALLVLRACMRHHVEDPTLYSILARQIGSAVRGLTLQEVLIALELFYRYHARASGARRPHTNLFVALADRVSVHAATSAAALTQALSAISQCGFEDPALVRHLARAATEVRNLSYHDIVSITASFEKMNVLNGPLAEILEQRRVAYLDVTPLSTVLRALIDGERTGVPPWLLRVPEANANMFQAFLRRLESLGADGADAFEDPFDCLEFLVSRSVVPPSFLRSLCSWARHAVRARGSSKRKLALSARRLCLLDDACEIRSIQNVRSDLDDTIRSFVIHRQSEPKVARL